MQQWYRNTQNHQQCKNSITVHKNINNGTVVTEPNNSDDCNSERLKQVKRSTTQGRKSTAFTNVYFRIKRFAEEYFI